MHPEAGGDAQVGAVQLPVAVGARLDAPLAVPPLDAVRRAEVLDAPVEPAELARDRDAAVVASLTIFVAAAARAFFSESVA